MIAVVFCGWVCLGPDDLVAVTGKGKSCAKPLLVGSLPTAYMPPFAFVAALPRIELAFRSVISTV